MATTANAAKSSGAAWKLGGTAGGRVKAAVRQGGADSSLRGMDEITGRRVRADTGDMAGRAKKAPNLGEAVQAVAEVQARNQRGEGEAATQPSRGADETQHLLELTLTAIEQLEKRLRELEGIMFDHITGLSALLPFLRAKAAAINYSEAVKDNPDHQLAQGGKI